MRAVVILAGLIAIASLNVLAAFLVAGLTVPACFVLEWRRAGRSSAGAWYPWAGNTKRGDT